MGTFAANPMGIGWGRLHKAPCSISPEGPLLGRMAARPAGDLDQLDQPDPHVQPDRRGLQDRLDRHVIGRLVQLDFCRCVRDKGELKTNIGIYCCLWLKKTTGVLS